MAVEDRYICHIVDTEAECIAKGDGVKKVLFVQGVLSFFPDSNLGGPP